MPPLSIAKSIVARPWLQRVLSPVANRYADLAGYRQIGLVADDLIAEETDVVQQAIKRLPPKVAYDRMYRMRRAVQCSVAHQILPKHEQTKPEDDVPYLLPYIEEIEAELRERDELDSLTKAK
ncbi:cytochrome b-c1 complex subunit 7 [Morchella snyderi]|nr:cytochrome b-c1 complex subunit 7 [Morchella snyderi]